MRAQRGGTASRAEGAPAKEGEPGEVAAQHGGDARARARATRRHCRRLPVRAGGGGAPAAAKNGAYYQRSLLPSILHRCAAEQRGLAGESASAAGLQYGRGWGASERTCLPKTEVDPDSARPKNGGRECTICPVGHCRCEEAKSNRFSYVGGAHRLVLFSIFYCNFLEYIY